MWKDTVGAYRCSVCIYKYMYISGFVRVCVFVYTYTYLYEKTLCVHTKCVHTNTYMSVLVSCLQMSFMSACRYMYICMYTWKTPWVDSDTLWAHRHTCTRICVCAWVRMYEWVDILVCVLVYVYMHVHQDYSCVRRVYMYMCMYLHTCTRVRIHAEFSCVIFSNFTYVGHHPVEV